MGVKKLVRVNFSDTVAFAAAGTLAVITVMIFLESYQFNYQVNTGIVCSIFCLLPFFMRHLNLITLPAALVFLIEVSIFLHAYGVLFLQYDAIIFWDTVTHTMSSLTVALCVFFTLLMISTYDPRVTITPTWMAFFVFITMLTMGVYWEVFEMVVDEVTGTTMQYSPWDTVRDIACDALGGAIISIYAYYFMKKRDGKELVESLELHPRLQRFLHRGSRSDHGLETSG